MRAHPHSPLLALALSLTAPPAAADVFIVDDDPGPGVDFADIQPAVDDAADGDVILVKDGSYDAFEIVAKSLVVLGEEGASVVIGPESGLEEFISIAVRDLGSGQRVLLRGFFAHGTPFGFLFPSMLLENNHGVVQIEDVELGYIPVGATNPALRVIGCEAVVLARCKLSVKTIAGGVALQSVSSVVSAFDCEFHGAPGGDLFPGDPLSIATAGGDAVHVAGGKLFASGSLFQGGQGGWLPASATLCETPGGDGLVLRDGEPVVVARGSTFAGGAGGTGGITGGSCPDPEGEGLIILSGTFTDLGGSARSLAVSAPVPEGGTLVETFTGEEGDLVVLAYAAAPAPPLFVPVLAGDVTLASPVFVVFKGALPSGGVLVDPVPFGSLAPGVASASVFFQAAMVDVQGGIFVSSPSAGVFLDAAFAP